MVRPDWRPRAASRAVRRSVAPGSKVYSAVIQPRPEPRSQPGTPSLSEAVQSTTVSPSVMRAEPAANLATDGSMASARSSFRLSGAAAPVRMLVPCAYGNRGPRLRSPTPRIAPLPGIPWPGHC